VWAATQRAVVDSDAHIDETLMSNGADDPR